VPTLIAQQLFQPAVLDREEEEALGEEDISIIHHGRPGTAAAAGNGEQVRAAGHDGGRRGE
jgi:hypothetical protein